MNQPYSIGDRLVAAGSIFEEFLARRGAGETLEFDTLVRAHPDLEVELRELHAAAAEVDRAFDVGRGEHAAEMARVQAILSQLGDATGARDRYVLEGEIGKGGMGIVYRVRDTKLERTLAMKVIIGQAEVVRSGKTPPVPARKLARFVNEARLTGQLDHPGIVPVHEVGVDADGRAFFTMKLVQGITLAKVFELRAANDPQWTLPRVLDAIQRVCEAVSFAHERGTIHRDLKPANVMVGNYGEVYVMDWGLAKRLGEEEEIGGATGAVEEELGKQASVSHEGDVLGTPSYMSPEQARGEISRMDARSDVYAIGAMLYHLLAGRAPYTRPEEKPSGAQVLARVVSTEPAQLDSTSVPPELAAICEKAMSREPMGRYENVRDLADDLGRFLGGRSVRAFRVGPWVDTQKWVKRNKPLAGAIVGIALVSVAGALAFALKAAEAKSNLERLLNGERTAQIERAKAEQTTNDVLSLSAQKDLDDFVSQADELWPANQKMIPKYEAWLEHANELLNGRPADPEKGLKKRPSLAEFRTRLEALRAKAIPSSSKRAGGPRYEYADQEVTWWDRTLSKLVDDLESLKDPNNGLINGGLDERFGWGIKKRLQFASTIRERSTDGPEAAAAWSAAISAIRQSPRYGHLELKPQVGLLPIGEDPTSRLFEFAHLQTGEPAHRNADGTLEPTEAIGLVFVLMPGGTFWMGAQKTNPSDPNFESTAQPDEAPVRQVTLSPYFMSKYEMTQAQWHRATGSSPSVFGQSHYASEWNRGGKPWSGLHPVEQVSQVDCTRALARLELDLPSEAQWERAARGGTSSPYWAGDGLQACEGTMNVADKFGHPFVGAGWGDNWAPELDDGNAVHAEVGSYRANPMGFHDVCGNVWEWCLDIYQPYSRLLGSKNPVRNNLLIQIHVMRGGSYSHDPSEARCAFRGSLDKNTRDNNIGCRPARAVE